MYYGYKYSKPTLSNRIFCHLKKKMFISVLSNTMATSYMWLLNTWNIASVTEKPNFKFLFNFYFK